MLYIKEFKNPVNEISLETYIKKVLLESSNNLSWLKKGDKVLLKPALNSPDPYPSTTSPLAIKIVKQVLENHGAKVIIADQSGLEHVISDESGVIKGNSKDNYIKSSMGNIDDEFISIESRDWNSFKKIDSKSWSNGFYITDLIDEVDHIINLPRVSTHMQAGVTLAFKNIVGLIRTDSRVEFHCDGPFNFYLQNYAKIR